VAPAQRILFLPKQEGQIAMAAGEPVDPTTPVSVPGAPDDRLPLNADGQASGALNLASPMFNVHPSPQGIGGWLVIVAIGLVISPFLTLGYMWTDFHSLTSADRVLAEQLVPGLTTLVGFEFFGNAFLFAAWLPVFVLFLRQRRLFPRTYQLWLGAILVARAAEYTLSFRLGTGATGEGAATLVQNLHSKLGLGVLKALVAAAIWISYVGVSERVKATFVN
jgi:hypothetical protein